MDGLAQASDEPSGREVHFPPIVKTGLNAVGRPSISLNVSPLAAGSHTLRIKAFDSTGASGYVDVPITVNTACGSSGGSGPVSNWRGLMYNNNGALDQAVEFTVAKSGSYPFDAYLYYGATCDPAQFTDRFGFGVQQSFSAGATYMYAFIHYPNKTNMSAIWKVGTQSSPCISYANAPVE